MDIVKECTYFKIIKHERRPDAKRDTYSVISAKGVFLGTIEWFKRWSKYTLNPDTRTVWSVECLQDVIDFIEEIQSNEKTH